MNTIGRRALLRFLAASPLAAGLAAVTRAYADDRGLASAADALDVFDFEAAAQKIVPPAHWGYLQSGVDGEATLRANQAAFSRYALKPRRFVDVSHIDLGIEVFGAQLASPIFFSPSGLNARMLPIGEKKIGEASWAPKTSMPRSI